MNHLIDVHIRTRAHRAVIDQYNGFTQLMVKCLCSSFKLIFNRRWHLSQEHIKRSSLGVTEQESRLLAQYALEHLALTATQSVKRALSYRKKSRRIIQGTTIKDRLDDLDTQSICLEGRSHLESALDSSRGLIVLSAHIGAWEELISLGTWIDRPVMVISKRMSNPVAQWFWDRSRREGPRRLDQGQRARAIINLLKQGGVIADVLDQHDPRSSALSISFLGRSAQTSGDLARIAIASDALIVPIFLLRGPMHDHNTSKFTLLIGQTIDHRSISHSQRDQVIREITQRCLQQIESIIVRVPEQWMWLHRRWKSPPK